MKTALTRVWFGFSLLIALGGSSIFAQEVPEKFTVVQTAGPGITFTIFGRTFPLKAGDVLPAGSTVSAPSGTNLVVSPALGVLVAVNGGSKVQFVSNATLLTGKEPATEILVNLIFGKVTVNSGPYLSPKSHLAINTPQGLFSTNNAAFSAASVLINRGGIQSSVGGVEVDSGKVRASLASGEELGVSAGQNLVGRTVGTNLTRAITNGKLPDTLVDFVPGERQINSDADIFSMSGGFASEQDAVNLVNSMSEEIKNILVSTSLSSIPALLLIPFSSDEKILSDGQEIGLNSEPIFAEIEGILNTATNGLIQQQMLIALGIAKVGAPTNDPESGPPNIRQLLTNIATSIALAGGEDPQQLALPISLVLAPNFTSPQNTIGNVGKNFTYQFTTDDPSATIRIDQPSLPTWLTINGTTISGIPPAIGNYTVRASAFNVSGLSTSFVMTIMVSPQSSPIISITQSPTGNLTVGNSYTFTINVQAPYPYDLSESGLPSWLNFPTVTNSTAQATSVTVTIPASAATTSGTIFATAKHTGGNENATAMLSYTVNPLPSTLTITLATVGTQTYLSPTSTNTSADLNTISSPLPGMDIATFDALVTNPAFGNGGLYWPWTTSALGQSLLQNGFKPDGDVFAAYYVYTHYKTIAGVVTYVPGGITDGSGIQTPGTYTGPGSTFSYNPTNLTIFP